eukprot:TRINITY_DN10651_c0_g1_i1.p1 TRINITY_DN10651_c0_g1~~TRINITY_DN10651_c0_g1_i1.p1  ORF type:complete len:114 (-),score=1.75 TRINITY_DN10651_c0_g1_i1:194-535(-)
MPMHIKNATLRSWVLNWPEWLAVYIVGATRTLFPTPLCVVSVFLDLIGAATCFCFWLSFFGLVGSHCTLYLFGDSGYLFIFDQWKLFQPRKCASLGGIQTIQLDQFDMECSHF